MQAVANKANLVLFLNFESNGINADPRLPALAPWPALNAKVCILVHKLKPEYASSLRDTGNLGHTMVFSLVQLGHTRFDTFNDTKPSQGVAS